MNINNQSSNPLRSLARRLTVLAIVISPWLIGSSDGWAYLLMCMLIGAAAIIWMFSLLSEETISLTAPKTLLAMILFAAFAACQTIPLPSQILKILSPASAEMASKTEAVSKSVTDVASNMFLNNKQPSLSTLHRAEGSGAWAHSVHSVNSVKKISVSASSTHRVLLLIIAFISVFAILSNTITTWSELQRTAISIVTFGALMAFIGTIHKLSDSSGILWFHIPRYGGTVYGPFTNTNHFAVHINMIFAVALGLFLSHKNSTRYITQKSGNNYIDYSRTGQLALILLSMTIMGGAACFSLSRGGIVALLGSIGIISILSSISHNKDRSKQSRRRLKASIFLIVAGTIWFGWEPVVKELGSLSAYAQDPLHDGRFTLLKDTLKVFMRYPLCGSGFGTFQYVFPSFQSLVGYKRFLHAHNDWAQLMAEGGVIGTGLFLLALGFWGRYIRSNFKKAATEARFFTIGALIGICATAIYSLWEYGLHKPANGFLLMGLAGMSVAAISMRESSSEHKRRHSLKVREATAIPSGPATRLGIVSLILLTSWIMGSMLLQFKGKLAYTRFIYYQRLVPKTETAYALAQTIISSCEEAEMMYTTPIDNPAATREVSEVLLAWSRNPKLDTETRTLVAKTSLDAAVFSVKASPSDYLAWLALARTHGVLGRWETAEIYLNHARALAAPGMPVRMFKQRK